MILRPFTHALRGLAAGLVVYPLAERIEKKQQIKFTEGLSTSFEFNDAQRQLYAAQQEFLQAMVNVISKKATLDKITN